MKRDKFAQDRHNAFEDIRRVFMKKMDALALFGATLGDTGKMSMPDYLRTEESFRWPGAVLMLVGDLDEGKPLKEVFARVSGRYDPAARPKKPAVAGDLSPSGETDGRLSAFDDVLKALTIAERDFDETYKYLSKSQIEWWQKRHGLAPEHLQLAHKENQRHYMKLALDEVREVLTQMKNQPPAPGAASIKPPQP